ncbi:hypothetical protein J2T08_005728 [Neorhizobium galegae]|nr:hypothetical protein [Neorhizobium galegae]
MQEYPIPPSFTGLPGPPSGSRLETVPDPMMVPAQRALVFAAWAIRLFRDWLLTEVGGFKKSRSLSDHKVD